MNQGAIAEVPRYRNRAPAATLPAMHPSSAPTLELQARVRQLHAERQLAALEGLDSCRRYVEDLELEIAATRNSYVGAVVTEIATLRAELFGAQMG